jgi:hypothetical protein
MNASQNGTTATARWQNGTTAKARLQNGTTATARWQNGATATARWQNGNGNGAMAELRRLAFIFPHSRITSSTRP